MDKREPARCFQDLILWQKAHAFVRGVYASTRTFPRGWDTRCSSGWDGRCVKVVSFAMRIFSAVSSPPSCSSISRRRIRVSRRPRSYSISSG